MENDPTKVVEVEPNGGETTDWEAKYNEMKQHSREWERKAKANKEAADELAALKESQMSEQERLQKQLDEATARANALQEEKDRRQWVDDAATETGVPAEILSLIAATDRDDLMSKAAGLKDRLAVNGQPTVPVVLGDGKHADVKETGSAKDDFAQFMKNAFN
jgi:hypothetical protein